MTTISYVVTLYNKAVFLPYLLAGLGAQTGDFGREFVFVDDGSTDDTPSMLRDLTRDWQNVTIVEQKNAGPSAALNRGLAAMTGEFVKPVDGDDLLVPWATECLLGAIADTGCPVAYTLDASQKYRLDQTPADVIAGLRKPPIAAAKDGNTLKRVLHGTRTNPSMWLARSDLVRRVGGCDDGVFVQDYSLELRLAAAAVFARVDSIIMLGPEDAPGRLSDNQVQTLHDANRAVVRFVRAHPEISRSLRNYAIRRAAGRAWNWARRRGGKTHLSREFRLTFLAYCGVLAPSEAVEAALCRPFHEKAPVRIPLSG